MKTQMDATIDGRHDREDSDGWSGNSTQLAGAHLHYLAAGTVISQVPHGKLGQQRYSIILIKYVAAQFQTSQGKGRKHPAIVNSGRRRYQLPGEAPQLVLG